MKVAKSIKVFNIRKNNFVTTYGERGFLDGLAVKNLLILQERRGCGFHPWMGKIPWRRKSQPTPVPLPGKIYGQRSLVGYSPWGCIDLDMTEHEH